MADRNILTQVGIEELKFALSEVAENLSSHINASLAKAHGINLVAGFIDQYGNNLTSYRDDHGDFIALYFLRWVIGGAIYYSPAHPTAFDGQPETTGIVDTSAEGGFQAQGGSAWVTDYTSDQVQQAEAMNQDVLIPHTRQPHDATHGSLTVVQQNSFTSVGHTYGTHVISMRINGNVYTIAASNRLGGPLQAPRFQLIPTILFIGPTNGTFGLVGTDLTEHVNGGDPWPDGVLFRTIFSGTGGTFPMNYEWQFSADNSTWLPMDQNRSVNDCGYSPSTPAPIGTLNTAVGSFDARFGLITPGGNNGATFFMRLKLTNATGTYFGQTIRVIQKDETASFTVLCGVALDLGYISNDVYNADCNYTREHVDAATYAGYSLWAKPLAAWFRKHPKAFAPVAPLVVAWAKHVAGERNLLGRTIEAVGVPICRTLGRAVARVK